jgi:hypothetical protein
LGIDLHGAKRVKTRLIVQRGGTHEIHVADLP